MRYKKLTQYAKDNGICYHTAYNYFKKGLLENVKVTPTRTILVGYEEDIGVTEGEPLKVAVYSRVSSNDQKDDLGRQQLRLEEYATSKGYTIVASVKEVASGMNDERKRLASLLKRTDYNILLVEHKDRLTRFGFNYITTLLEKSNIKVEVVNLARNDDENLMEDLVSIIYSFSARMYGKRRSKRVAEKVLESLENDIS